MVRKRDARRVEPRFAYALNRAFYESDLRPILPAVKAPTLVFYRRGSPTLEQHLDVARRIEDAHAVALAGSDYWGLSSRPRSWTRSSSLWSGKRSWPCRTPSSPPFSSPTSSARPRAAELGDRALEGAVEITTRSFGGTSTLSREELDAAGDGFFAVFDGPIRAIRCAHRRRRTPRARSRSAGGDSHRGVRAA